MNANELRDKSPDQLRDELVALKKEALIYVFSRRLVRWKIRVVCAKCAVVLRELIQY